MALKYYKLLEERWATNMLEKGEIRIGTISDFRKFYERDKIRGDEKEGKVNEVTKIDRLHLPDKFTQHDIPGAARKYLRFPNGGSGLLIENCTFSVVRELSDKHVFCGTTKPSKEMMERFGKDTEIKTDTCIKILDLHKFSVAIAKQLNILGMPISRVDYKTCTYADKEVPFGDPTDYFLKDPEYQWQHEFRIIFQHHPDCKYSFDPKTIYVPAIMPLIRKIPL